jgi:hypothetical protein
MGDSVRFQRKTGIPVLRYYPSGFRICRKILSPAVLRERSKVRGMIVKGMEKGVVMRREL